MTSQHYDDGVLRAFADNELPPHERIQVNQHLASCAVCQRQLRAVQALSAEVGTLLATPAAIPDPSAALQRLRTTERDTRMLAVQSLQQMAPIDHQNNGSRRTTTMQTTHRRWFGPRRTLATVLATAVVAVGLLLFPPVRAVADQLLQVFRVRSVMFMPVSPERVQQLENLDFDPSTLFVSDPEFVNTPAAPRKVATLDEAAPLLGFLPHAPSMFPTESTNTEYVVQDRRVVQAQLNVDGVRQLVELLGVQGVELPAGLGDAPITGEIPPVLQSKYVGADYQLQLIQGPSPSINLPDGVDLAQLGKAGLLLLGAEPAQAEQLSQSIDWNSTLLFPFPANVANVQQVTVNGEQALLVGQDEGDSNWQLYWQHDDRFYILEGQGVRQAEILLVADSVR